MPGFEVLMVTIDWESPDRIREVKQSKTFLKPSKVQDRKHEYDIVLYTKENEQYYQFAIKTKHTPFLKVGDGRWNQNNRLFNIGNELWIIKGEWRVGQRGIGYHHCPSINTIGKIDIGISENLQQIQNFVTIDINSNIEDFDFKQLKNDFEGELWNLITSNKSKVSSDKVELRYCDKVFRYPENKTIVEFLKSFDHIERNPKRELSPSKEIRKIEKVIPITETYRKISTTGTATLLPSKSVKENHDIFENRFVCFMLHSINQIVSKNLQYTSLQIERLDAEIKFLNDRIEILEDTDPKVIPEEVEQQISFQEQRVNEMLNHWRTISNGLPQNGAGTFTPIKIKIKHSHHTEERTFWCSTNTSAYCLFKFPTHVMQYVSEGTEFHFEAVFSEDGRVTTNAGKTYPRFIMNSARKIASAEFYTERNILNRQRSNKTILENNNWSQLSILNGTERTKFQTERSNQVQTLKKKIEKIKVQIQNIGNFNEEQSNLKPLIEQRIRTAFFKRIKRKNIQGFKPSMTFIQNISYRNALRYYKEILKSEGIELDVFDLYENVTNYGLREMPQVYELWCLITQIKILEESFHFKHEPSDLVKLLKTIDPTKEIISQHSVIKFTKRLAGRSVKLHYQKSIDEDKRPDFILQITSSNREINLVLDSKFKNYNYKKSIIYESIGMMDKYRQGENFVFILHPCKDGIFENRNIKYTNHGGERIFFGEGENQQTRFPFHEYGYIELKPNHTDTLKKLIAMSFEYLLEPTRNAKQDNNQIDPKPENDMFCLNCGGTNISTTESRRGDNRHFYSCSCDASDCGHKIYIDYCWNCKSKLFKHGSYWDYHLESTWSIFDIRCPNCGMTVADRPQNNNDY
jgi:hypothetical protein